MNIRTIYICLTLLFPILFANAQNDTNKHIGDDAVQKFVATKGFQAASLGVLVKDVETGEVVAEYQSQQNRIPASITKALTTATALEILTDTFRFVTTLNYSGEIIDSVLHGNLYIVGGGDPTMESDYFPHNPIFVRMLKAIQLSGIKNIDGEIVGDASLYQRMGAHPGWLTEDIGTNYAQTPTALCFHDNLFAATCIGNDSTGNVEIENILPHSDLYKIDNRMLPGTPIWWHIYGDVYSWNKIVRGRVPANKKTVVQLEIPDPSLLMADSLNKVLNEAGIKTKGARSNIWTSERAPKENCIYKFYSLPIGTIIKKTNYQSVNLFAENFFLYLSTLNGSIGSYETAPIVVSNHWKNKGISTSTLHQVDGSGLSMKNGISPEVLTNVLVYMKKKSKYSQLFLESLPKAGINGTVKSFMAGTNLAGKAWAKSGSMERVLNYTGYIQWNKRWYAFTVMVNNYDCTRAQCRTAAGTLLNNVMMAIGGPDATTKKTTTTTKKTSTTKKATTAKKATAAKK
ncbi:MAG: D-alanyl-D-alanine carboxypeptidase/D-alanyl-D-alanine-endopeptidase [Bacteroidales bacterium]|nr:D-alanyl-D-alanine carboxypeptidase/D-alanyl-D-alanine-endopeptidase [Candidatus Physcocola equi]